MRAHDEGPRTSGGDSCGDCPVAHSRRAFLRDVGMAAAAAVASVAFLPPSLAFAEEVAGIAPLRALAMERSYSLPRKDSVSVDEANDVILARWDNKVYAFSLKCPHKGAQLEWRANEQRVFCPKHKARFTAEGDHVSGRGSRDLDRYAIRLAGGSVSVDLGTVYRADRHPEQWAAAVLAL